MYSGESMTEDAQYCDEPLMVTIRNWKNIGIFITMEVVTTKEMYLRNGL